MSKIAGMRIFQLSIVLLGLVLPVGGAHAAPGAMIILFGTKPMTQPVGDSGACYAIGDADARATCLARAHKDPGRCYSVQRADMRAQCLAEVRR